MLEVVSSILAYQYTTLRRLTWSGCWPIFRPWIGVWRAGRAVGLLNGPRLPGVRDRVSVARAVWRPDGEGPRSDRAPCPASLARACAAAVRLSGTFSASPAYGAALCWAALVPAPRCASADAATRHARSL